MENYWRKLKAWEVIEELNMFEIIEDKNGYHIRTLFDIGRITKEQYNALKEVQNNGHGYLVK